MARVTRRVPQSRASAQHAGRMAVTALEPILLTSRQAAQLLGCSIDTLLCLDIPFVRLGNGKQRPHRGYRRAALEEWAKRREAPA